MEDPTKEEITLLSALLASAFVSVVLLLIMNKVVIPSPFSFIFAVIAAMAGIGFGRFFRELQRLIGPTPNILIPGFNVWGMRIIWLIATFAFLNWAATDIANLPMLHESRRMAAFIAGFIGLMFIYELVVDFIKGRKK
jgi:hypothetical protein